MKKFFICGLIIAAVSVITFSTSCLSTERPVNDIVKLLPENTDFMLKIGSVETVYKHFSVTENSVFGEPVKEIEDIKAELGFNPLVLSDLKSNGFDTGKDIGFMFNDFKFENEKPDFNFLIFIPVTDGKKVVDKIKTWAKKENSEVKFIQDGNITAIKEKNDNLYMFTKANYLFIGGNTNAKDAKAFVKTAEAGKTSLLKTKIYKDAAKKVPGKDLFAFINVPKVMPKALEIVEAASKKTGKPMPDIGNSLKYIEDYQGACLSVNLENNDLVINGAGNIVSDSKLHNIYKGVNFKKETVLGIKDNPAILFSAALNAREYYNFLMETFPEEEKAKFKSGLQEIKTTVGIDVEKEVIENLAGSFNLGIYDGLSINIMNYNTVLSLSVKDEALMKKVIEKAISSMPPEKQQMAVKTKLGNLDVYAISVGGGMTQLYIGIKDKNLIVSVGKPMFEKAVSGKVSSGFTSAMADKKLAGTLKKENTNIIYFNVSEIYSIFKTFATFANKFSKSSSPDKPAVDPRVEELINQFDYLLVSSWMEGNSSVTEMTFKTNFKEPFFKGLVNFSKELQKLKPAKKPDAPKKEEEKEDDDDKPGLPKKQS